ncbi:MAG: helix-turn-helix domain-containing protein [Gammaproteobacteria bacterium]|jgi:transcriptional regulator with XRE-family HTH domain
MNLDLLLAMQNDDFRRAFGGRLKELRKHKRWSQKELAAKVDIRFQQLNKYESGLNLPPAEMLIKLADALGTTIDHLLTGNPAEDNPLGNARLFKRFKAVEGFDPDDREAVITLIDAMIAKQQMQTTLTSLDDQAVNA